MTVHDYRTACEVAQKVSIDWVEPVYVHAILRGGEYPEIAPPYISGYFISKNNDGTAVATYVRGKRVDNNPK